MFEHYSEKARRTIFFARYEASQFGTPQIEAAFLMLALFREDKVLLNRISLSESATQKIRKEVEIHTVQGPKFSTAVDVPLSDECKRALEYATQESKRLNHPTIGCEHLLLGLLREEQSLPARLLQQQGVTLAKAREDLQKYGPVPSNIGARSGGTKLPFSFPVTTVKVADLATSISFYAALGFRLTQDLASGQIAFLSSGPFQIALVHQSMGADLFCFMVGDLPSVATSVQSAGHTMEQPLTTAANGSQSLLLRDPDNNLVLLVSAPPS